MMANASLPKGRGRRITPNLVYIVVLGQTGICNKIPYLKKQKQKP